MYFRWAVNVDYVFGDDLSLGHVPIFESHASYELPKPTERISGISQNTKKSLFFFFYSLILVLDFIAKLMGTWIPRKGITTYTRKEEKRSKRGSFPRNTDRGQHGLSLKGY